MWLAGGSLSAYLIGMATLLGPLEYIEHEVPPVIKEMIQEESYSINKMQTLLNAKKNVFVKVGADWCHYCVENRKFFHMKSVGDAFSKAKVTVLNIDLTEAGNAQGMDFMEQHKQMSIPFYVMYSFDDNGVMKITEMASRVSEKALIGFIKDTAGFPKAVVAKKEIKKPERSKGIVEKDVSMKDKEGTFLMIGLIVLAIIIMRIVLSKEEEAVPKAKKRKRKPKKKNIKKDK
jgi:hypothetical protein